VDVQQPLQHLERQILAVEAVPLRILMRLTFPVLVAQA
jgi:hypothetical protein